MGRTIVALLAMCSVLIVPLVDGQSEHVPRRRLQQQQSGGQQFSNQMMPQQNLMQQQHGLSQSSGMIQNGGSSGALAQQGNAVMHQGGSSQNGGSSSQFAVSAGVGQGQESFSQIGGSDSQSVSMQGHDGTSMGSSYPDGADRSQSSGMQDGTANSNQNGGYPDQSSESQAYQSGSGSNKNSQGTSGSLRGSSSQEQNMQQDAAGSNGQRPMGLGDGESSSMPSGGNGQSDYSQNDGNGSFSSGSDSNPLTSNSYSSQTVDSESGMQSNGGSQLMEGETSNSMGEQSSNSLQGQNGYGSPGEDSELSQPTHLGGVEGDYDAQDQSTQTTGSIQYPEKVEGWAAGGLSSSNVASAGGYASYQGTSSDYSNMDSSNGQGYGNDDSMMKPKHGKFNIQEDDANCQPLQPKEMQVSPTWISSFPGSGSKMTWQSIEAITGLFTGDDMDSRGKVSKGVAVAIKTHYPSHTQENVFRQKKFDGIDRGILVLRNPLLAIPAIFRFVYFVEQGNERQSKSEQPPRKAWNGWRNEYLESELKLWVDHAQFWLDNYKRENLHLVPFEYLVSPERGSDELQKMGNFLGSADPNIASSLLAPEKFCCVWEKLVDHEENAAPSAPQYTAEQLEAMIQSLLKLRNNNKSFPEFFKLMDEYIGDIVLEKKTVIAKSKY